MPGSTITEIEKIETGVGIPIWPPKGTQRTATRPRVELSFIEPMYAEPVRQLPDSAAWSYEAKYDGSRCLAARQTGGVVLWSRRGNSYTTRFAEIAYACATLAPHTLIDGEVVAIDESGRISFNALQHSHARSHLQFYVFDVLIHRGRNVMGLPLAERRELLDDSLTKVEYAVLRSMAFEAKPTDLIRAAKELQFEGIIAKRNGSLYEPGKRSGAWQKYKINQSQEFVIGGYTPGNPFDALIVGVYDGAALKFVSKVRADFVPHSRREVFQKLKALETDKCPFANLPERRRTMWALTAEEMKSCQWVKPKLVAQIEFTEWTPDGHLRQSSYAGLRQDKDPKKITREL